MKDSVITADDGRELAITEAGDLSGVPVVVHHGTPGSKGLFPDWVADAEQKGARLIGFNRPGYGASTPRPGRQVADVAEDVATICDRLGIERFATWGISGGGPHALACAALMPGRVIAAASLAGVAPYVAEGLDWFAGMGEDNVTEFNAALGGREELRTFMVPFEDQLRESKVQDVISMLRTVIGEADTAVLNGELGELLAGWFREAASQGIEGWLDDDLAFARDWGVDLGAIEVPVLVWQGADDKMVPYAHGVWLGGRIPGADVRLRDEEGHLTLLVTRMPETLDWLLSHN
jgi:pimeloyl-ACP methyl ester carboxylesterase